MLAALDADETGGPSLGVFFLLPEKESASSRKFFLYQGLSCRSLTVSKPSTTVKKISAFPTLSIMASLLAIRETTLWTVETMHDCITQLDKV